ncbi:HEAT repeat domain-containing protein [Stieleria sp. ICT_E10.1]|uniref:HEAT repeat domain-containing protein n=1 Tax=Stieleria sedimenti TaxID=2976331 RepID=UPI00217F7CA8|nr:HEAT repeat domain-containing protein [Stieleria sedimenti]MCS7466550.1 HEAT repeat domain-containing protein [Stieleria sedimenti]
MNLRKLLAVLLAVAASATAKADQPWELTPTLRQKCLTVLRQGLTGQEFWPAMHAAESLTFAEQGQEVRTHLLPKLETETDDQRRCGLARELARTGDQEKSTLLLEILRENDPHGHVHAAESLYKVGWPGGGTELQTAFANSSDIRVRIMAAAALAKYDQGPVREESFEFLRQTLRDEKDPALFRLAAWILGRIGEPKDCVLIRSRLEDAKNDALTQAFLEHALAALGDPQSRKVLMRNLQSTDSAIRTYAAVFAGESGMTNAAPFLIRQLDDENLDARIRAAGALLALDRQPKSSSEIR